MKSRLLLFTVLVAVSALSRADIAMLIRFDEAGHHIHRVFALEEESPMDSIFGNRRSTERRANAPMRILWFDSAGLLLNTSYHLDPRRTHAPTTGGLDVETVTWVAMQVGAYRVTGPTETASIVLELPQREMPPLSAERWILTLP